MIYGIGTDIVSIARIERGIQRHGERFARRILAVAELEEFAACGQAARFLAKRFAAKEAAAKAFGTGFSNGLSLRHITVAHDCLGRPLLRFSGRAAELVKTLGIAAASLSVSDEREYAIAFVTLERAG